MISLIALIALILVVAVFTPLSLFHSAVFFGGIYVLVKLVKLVFN